MSIEVVMPKMGESIQEGTILRWVKNVGDTVERDDVLLEISTDKVDTEVPSPAAGTIVEIRAAEGDVVEVGKVIAILSSDATAPAPAPAAAPAPTPTPTPTPTPSPAPAAPAGAGDVDVVMPKMGESIQEGTILRWVKQVGETVERDDVLLEISTDKVDTEVPSPASGTLVAHLASEGDVVEVGAVIAKLSTGAAVAAPAPAAAPVTAPAPAPATAPVATAPAPVAPAAIATASVSALPRTSGGRFYSPLVRSIASAEGLSAAELDAIPGTGLEGRVTKNDMLAYLQNRGSAPVTPSAPRPAAAPVAAPAVASASLSTSNGTDDIEVIQMDRVRQLIADHMVRSKQTSPHVTSVAEADVTGIVKLREKVKGSFEKREGFKLTYTPFFGVAVVDGVKAFPMINVSVDGKNILRHRRVNLGMAAATPDGNLIVPVVKNADIMNVTGIARTMNDLGNRAKAKKLSPDEIAGGTITLTNVGSFGSLFGTPVINQPQTAIIGIGAIQKRPVVRTLDGEDVIVIRSMVYLSITYDHRVIDGALATQALAAMVRSLESMNEDTVTL